MLHLFAHPVVSCCTTTPNMSFVPWSPKHSATMLQPFAQIFQQCWDYASTLHMTSKVFWVVSFPQYTAGQQIVGSCCICLHTTPLWLQTQHLTTLLAHQCWELLPLFAHHCDCRPNNSLLAHQCWQLLCLFACTFRKCYILAGCRQTYIVQVTQAPTPP